MTQHNPGQYQTTHAEDLPKVDVEVTEEDAAELVDWGKIVFPDGREIALDEGTLILSGEPARLLKEFLESVFPDLLRDLVPATTETTVSSDRPTATETTGGNNE